jgi:hypothetical protein
MNVIKGIKKVKAITFEANKQGELLKVEDELDVEAILWEEKRGLAQ